MMNTITQRDVEYYRALQQSPILFVEIMWGLVPERDNSLFVKGKHITWQQHDILLAVEKALRGEGSYKIAIASGHGIGKTAVLSWLILWYLFCYKNCQIPCTAPTSDQIYDVLWKELALWIGRMPEGVKQKYVWEATHIRINESPQTWFARAKTSSKENTEALAGVHADHVMLIADEASGIPEQVFNTAEGSMTSPNTLVIMPSNPTRIDGYFYNAHHKFKGHWQTLQFSSMDSPIVDTEYENKIAEQHGRESDEYKIRVLGQFPDAGTMDDAGYIPLIDEKDIKAIPDTYMNFPSNSIMGVDPSGEGTDKTSFVIRDNFKAKKIYEELHSTPKSIAEKILTFIDMYGIQPSNVVVDNFGVGADVGKEVALASKGKINIKTVNVGEPCDRALDQEEYLNKRAEAFYEMKKWLSQGGQVVSNKRFIDEIISIRYKRNLRGKIQIMPKIDMKKKYGLDSPNDADAFSLTFLRKINQYEEEVQRIVNQTYDKFGIIPEI